MRRRWLRRNRLQTPPAGHAVPEGRDVFLAPTHPRSVTLVRRPLSPGFEIPHFLGEPFDRRPWAVKREDRPAAFAGCSLLLFSSFDRWDTWPAHTGEYPIPTRRLLLTSRRDSRELDEEDRRVNELSVVRGSRLLSADTLSSGTKPWIITEADRSATTLMLTLEY